MILDSLPNARLYHRLHPGLARAFAWLEGSGPSATDGTHEIGDGVRAIVQGYETAPDQSKKWETHRRNLDLQVVLEGSELVGWAPVAGLSSRVPYDETKDAEFYHPPAVPGARFQLARGLFAIFFPDDAHQPGVQEALPAKVRKVVFKIPL
jgi:YhcH/YjgK/YiaL family protein